MRSSLVRGLSLSFTILLAAGSGVAGAQSSGDRLGPFEIAGDEPSYLDFGAGTFGTGFGRAQPSSAAGRLEFRFGGKLYDIGPAVGVVGTTRGAVFGYGALYADLRWGRNLFITGLAGPGVYRRGHDVDLGGTFQFRLGLAAAYELADASRVALQYGHISNAGIHHINPSDNELLLTYAIPLQGRF
jgi:lipid A 3-O-deacylase